MLRGAIDEIEIHDEIDIILSPWYGQFLVQNNLIDSVIFARDKFLKKNGYVNLFILDFPYRREIIHHIYRRC